MSTLFDKPEPAARAPLAVRMRPRTLSDVIGHETVLRPGSPVRRLIEESEGSVSVILWGPPGSGKTTLASLIARGRHVQELSAVTAGVKDVREVIELAKTDQALFDKSTVLFIDEVHRFNKSQQDALLPAVENGWVTLIAATTENPYFSVIAPLLSRSIVVTLEPLADSDVVRVIKRALVHPDGYNDEVSVTSEAQDALVRLSAGDARRALTVLEASVGVARERGSTDVHVDDVSAVVTNAGVRYDADGDQHYDVISAFIKSIRGSDVDAALHYLARMLEAGEDPRFIARRLMILASEDIGMADPSCLWTTTAALTAVGNIGLPEARLTLAHATIHCALAPKSNAVITAIDQAIADVRSGRIGTVPAHLRDGHYPGARELGHAHHYVYPHSEPEGIVAQQYLPDELIDVAYFSPTDRGAEARWGEIHRRALQTLRGDGIGSDDVGTTES